MNKKLLLIVVLLLLLIAAAVFLFFTRQAGESKHEFALAQSAQGDQRLSQAFLLPLAEASYFPLRDFNIAEPVIGAKAAVLFDTRSGKLLYQKDAFRQLPIASLTKLMTAVVIIEELNLDSIVTVLAEDLNVDGYGADLVKGEKIKAVDLLKIMLIKSSNDAALVFQSFTQQQGIDMVDKMNQKAATLGMNSTRFTNPAGLDDDAFSTAADLVKLVQYVGKHRLIWQILTIPSIEVTSADGIYKHNIVNTDRLLGQVPDIIGGKTGFTDRAIGTMILVVNVDRGFSNLIGVVLGSNDRFSDVRKIIEWGRMAYRWR